ncbi:MAG: hypothetical protein HRU38_24865 [Saccharospirillaceae bacterium]|nr:hypothetical protein [Pseudomonadales bacterium]NRB81854.1 hypothetical protein [Saccharospirillaceae bacterium]
MKFIAYLLVAANVALAVYYFTNQTEKDNQNQNSVSATLSNLSINKQNDGPKTSIQPITKEIIVPKPIIKQPIVKEVGVCIEINQILELESANNIQSFLNNNQISFELRQQQFVVKTAYAILTGPFSSTNRTKLEIKNLINDNIDYYLLPSGPNKGAISFGLYSNKQSAQNEVTKFIAKDYDVRLEENNTYNTQYFIDIPAKSSKQLTSELWNIIIKSHSAINKSKKDC